MKKAFRLLPFAAPLAKPQRGLASLDASAVAPPYALLRKAKHRGTMPATACGRAAESQKAAAFYNTVCRGEESGKQPARDCRSQSLFARIRANEISDGRETVSAPSLNNRERSLDCARDGSRDGELVEPQAQATLVG